MFWKPVNPEGLSLQGHSYRDGISWCADREDPGEPQTSRVKITVLSLCDEAVETCTGATSRMIRAQRTNTLIFLMSEM
ncbi:MAG: hypothetical protein H6Q94_659 [Nitrospirae bacterium]|nr:hypothetical protein [Nitrospirota bacterium]